MNQQEWTCICGKTDNRGKYCENCGRPQEQPMPTAGAFTAANVAVKNRGQLPVRILAVVVVLLMILAGMFAYNAKQQSHFEAQSQAAVQSLGEIKQLVMGIERLDGRVETTETETYLEQLTQAEESLDMLKNNLEQTEPGRKYGESKSALIDTIDLERGLLADVSSLVQNPNATDVAGRIENNVAELKTKEASLLINNVDFHEVLDWKFLPKAVEGLAEKNRMLKQELQRAAAARQKAALQAQCMKLLRGSWCVKGSDYLIEFDDYGLLILPEPGPAGAQQVVRRIRYKSFENMQVKAESGYASFDIVYGNGKREHIEINDWMKLRWGADSAVVFDKLRTETISDRMPASYQLVDE